MTTFFPTSGKKLIQGKILQICNIFCFFNSARDRGEERDSVSVLNIQLGLSALKISDIYI